MLDDKFEMTLSITGKPGKQWREFLDINENIGSVRENEDDGTAVFRQCVRVLAKQVVILARHQAELMEKAIDADDTDMEIDLSNLVIVNTIKLGVPIKTTISANVLEDAISGSVTVRPLPLGSSISGKVQKQPAQFFTVIVNEEQAQAGIIVRFILAKQFEGLAAANPQCSGYDNQGGAGYEQGSNNVSRRKAATTW
ncbi:DnaJ domain-containing protein [Artemisia annua]|uniref:DnaJ domain-containing protein n=1 Tax=Artemisia annua TaxID=35608 RepID=A0A2U1N6J0_ARTAN|nr:DnaJ domain-containing protein [Artemisia annua]